MTHDSLFSTRITEEVSTHSRIVSDEYPLQYQFRAVITVNGEERKGNVMYFQME